MSLSDESVLPETHWSQSICFKFSCNVRCCLLSGAPACAMQALWQACGQGCPSACACPAAHRRHQHTSSSTGSSGNPSGRCTASAGSGSAAGCGGPASSTASGWPAYHSHHQVSSDAVILHGMILLVCPVTYAGRPAVLGGVGEHNTLAGGCICALDKAASSWLLYANDHKQCTFSAAVPS